MKKKVDCLFIGHNQMDFSKHEESLRMMGIKSGAYRDLSLDFVQYNNSFFTAPDLFNHFYYADRPKFEGMGPFRLGNVFSNTIAYLGTYLHRRGLVFDYVNSFQDEREELIEKLTNDEILLIAVPTTLYVSVVPILEIMTFIRKYNKTARIVLGGPFIGAQMRSQDEISMQFLFKSIGADFYINSSQGEAALVNIVDSLKNSHPFENMFNVIYRSGNKYIVNPESMENNVLENNMIDWNLFSDRLGSLVGVRTSVSCPFSCSYCEYPQNAGKYQTVCVEAIENELNTISSISKVTSIGFIDDTFNVPPERFKSILKMIIKNKYSFKWNSFMRCQYVDREMVQLMKESGCEGVYLGVESGDQSILNNMNKNATVEKYKAGISLLKEYGINVLVSTLIGFPGETYDSVYNTIKFIEETEPDFLRIHLWYCSRQTDIWKKREEFKIKGSQFAWSHSTMDTNTACDMIAKMVLSLKNTIYVPQYNFDFAGVINLLNRGISLENVKEFLRGFNMGICEKLRSQDNSEISQEAVEKIKNALS